MVEYLNNNPFFNELYKIRNAEFTANNTRKPSVANTYKNEPSFQRVENLSRNYKRSGDAIYADPFPFHMKPSYNEYYNGRNLALLNTIIYNANKDKPDIITINPLTVIDYY